VVGGGAHAAAVGKLAHLHGLTSVCESDWDVQWFVGLSGDVRTFNMVMRALTDIKRWDEAMEVMGEMRACGLTPDVDSISSLFVNDRFPL
jgi:pentatricopeptide repeat protein